MAETQLPISSFYKVVDHVTILKVKNGGKLLSSSSLSESGQLVCIFGTIKMALGRGSISLT
ncbi:MAG: hypothetical protein QW270_00625 [Candidatus Bathyarchaeia archaeon]